MPNIKIAIFNLSTVLTDEQVRQAVPALQTQITRDFAPVWGIDGELVFVPHGSPPPRTMWWLGVFDDSDVAGALGYHDLTPQGRPLGKVFAATDLRTGHSWTVTMSHELLEMLADPDVNLTVFVQNSASTGRLYAYESCDACEAEEFAYRIDGTLVSDFVHPSWFQEHARTGTRFDHAGKIKAPLQLLPGGYIGVFDLVCGGWTQLHPAGAQLAYTDRPRVGSRRERRRTPRDQWQLSAVETA